MIREFTGTLRIIWLAIRRDRIQLPAWIAGIVILVAFSSTTYSDLFETDAELFAAAEFYANNPAARIFGMSSGATLGEYTVVETFVIVSVLTGLMSALAVVRHTRQSEETRQTEMLMSAAVGRYSQLAAAMIVTASANAVLAILLAFTLMANGLPAAGSVTAGLAIGAVGITFGGVAAVTSQVWATSRAASGMAVGFIGVAFLLASIGSVLGSVEESVRVVPAFPSWLSPIGWGQLMRPFGGNHLWLLLVFSASFAALTGIAAFLAARRDVGMGLIPEGRGPAQAGRSLLSPIGLAWRLQRAVFFAWAAAIAAFGVVMGAMGRDIEDALGELDAAEWFERIGGTDQLVDAYFVAVVGIYGTIISAFTIQVLLKMRAEETEGPLESLLATGVSRVRWMLSFVVLAVLGTMALLLLLGVSTGVAAGISFNDVGEWLPPIVEASLVQAPAVFVVAGVALLAFACLPTRAAAAGWAAFAIALLAGPMFGELFELPQAVMDISPFTHTPRLPASDFEIVPVLVMSALAATLTVASFVSFRRRDLVL